MAKKDKAAAKPKKAAKKAKAADEAVPSKLVLGKKGTGDDAKVYEAARVIQATNGAEYVNKGKLNLFLCQVTGYTETTEDAANMVADAFDNGVLKAFAA